MKRNPKRTLTAGLLALAMLLTLLPTAAFAASGEAAEEEESATAEQTEELTSETVSDKGYRLADDSETATSGTCGDNLTWTLEDGVLTISGTGSMANYYDAPWYGSRESITSVVIGDGVTSIGDDAFYGCTSLTSVTIPDSVTSIGYGAFKGCTGLTSVTIGSGVTSIDDYAFWDCTGLTSVTIPDSVTSIGYDAFYGCTGLTSVAIGSGVTSIDRNAFTNTAFYADENNWENGVLYLNHYLLNADADTLEGNYAIKEGTAVIASYAFNQCDGLTGVTIPDSVIGIGDWAFYYCTGLTSVTIPDSVTSIGAGAFDNTGLTGSVTIPDSVTYMGDSVFADCAGLTSVTISNNLTYISWTAFYNCTGLTSVVIPDSVIYIGNGAFQGCTNLSSVTVDNGVTSIGGGAFSGTAFSADETNWEDGVLYLGNYLLIADGHTLEENYAVKEGTTVIADYAFSDCTGLTGVTIPDSVTTIGEYAFFHCENLSSVTVGDGVTSIGVMAFSGAAFYANEDNWEDGVLYLGNYLLIADGHTLEENYAVKEGTTVIADYAFYDYIDLASLTSVTIPASVTNIGAYAFYRCTGLTDVYYSGSKTGWTAIFIGGGNIYLTSATIHYGSTDDTSTFLFSDVTNEESWYYNAVYWAYDLGITAGYEDGTFLPNKNCTRAEFATFLYALASAYGLENAGETTSTSFTDVTETGWYYTYVMWAAENGLVSGYSDGTFQPNREITRAEAVTMLYGFYKTFVNGGQEPTVSDETSGFSDLSDTAWYYTYMLWATQNDVVSGYPDGTCRPNTSCTRSVMVVLLYATANHLL